MGNSPTFKEQFQNHSEDISNQRASYEKIESYLEDIMNSVNEEIVEDIMDEVAPNDRQSSEIASEHSITSSDFPDLMRPENLQEYNMVQSTENSTSSQAVISNRLSDRDYYQLMNSLNIQQEQFVHHISFLVKTNMLPFHIFLSGGAGVGKFHTIQAIFQTLTRYFDSTPGNNTDFQRILIAAPTGRAAYNVHGNTVHALFAIPPNRSLKQYQKLAYGQLNTLRTQLSELQILIIDEVSMVGANMLNCIDQRMQEIFDSNRPFGNISLLFVGDLFQLRPVGDKWIFHYPSTPYGVLAPSFWTSNIQMFELTKIVRQNNIEYAEILNRIREAKHTSKDIEKLEERIVADTYILPTSPHLFTTNDLVDEYNATILGQLNTPTVISTATDSVHGQIYSATRAALLSEVKNYPIQQTQNLMENLIIKVGVQYMIVHNIDTSNGLTNGVPCTIKSFEKLSTGKPYLVWVQFEDENIGYQLKQKMKHLYIQGIQRSWVPISCISKQFDVRSAHNINIVREQFPLKPCFGMTIHKAQGATMPSVVILLTKCFAPHTVYAAISRSVDIEHIYLIYFKESQIKVDPLFVEEMTRLRRNHITLQPKGSTPNDETTMLMFNNTRSMHKHIDSLRSSSTLKHATMLILQETFLKPGDDSQQYNINHLCVCDRVDAVTNNSSRRHGGTVVLNTENTHYYPILSSALRII